VVSHIANGAKHFEVSDRRHKSVTNMLLHTDPWPDESGVSGEHIYISFNMDEGRFSGLELSALSMARLVLEFWKSNIEKVKAN